MQKKTLFPSFCPHFYVRNRNFYVRFIRNIRSRGNTEMMSAAFLACLCAPEFGVFWCMVFASWEGYQEPLGEFACKSPASDRQSHYLMSTFLATQNRTSLSSRQANPSWHGPLRVGIDEKWCDRSCPSQRMIPLANNNRNSSVLCMSVEAHPV